jgi:hypothetical protein
MNRMIGLLRLAPAAARTAAVGVVLTLGVSAIGGAWAETRIVDMDCPAQKDRKVTLKPGEDSVSFLVNSCVCKESAEELKNQILAGVNPGGGYSVGGMEIKPGQTITKTLYCYTMDQVLEFTASGSQ